MVALERINVRETVGRKSNWKLNFFSMYFVWKNEEIHLSFKDSEKWRTQALSNVSVFFRFTAWNSEPPIVSILYGWSGICFSVRIIFYCFSCRIMKVNKLILFLHLSSSLLHTKYLIVLSVYVSIEYIDCILFLLLALNAIFLTF